MTREIWRKYLSEQVYVVEMDHGRVTAAAGPTRYTDVINLWPQPWEFVNDPWLAAELDGQQGSYLRCQHSINPNAVVVAPRLLEDTDILIVRPSKSEGYTAPAAYMVMVEGPQLDNGAIEVAWSGSAILRRTEITFGEVKQYIKPAAIDWLNKASLFPVRRGYGGYIPTEIR